MSVCMLLKTSNEAHACSRLNHFNDAHPVFVTKNGAVPRATVYPNRFKPVDILLVGNKERYQVRQHSVRCTNQH